MSTPSYDESVFINCPFDREYREIFDAIVFAVHDCGFVPRSAWESIDSGVPRIHQLYELIAACRLGIHDLSRTEGSSLDKGSSDSPLPRFNMPLELGIFLGARNYGDENQRKKRTLILDSQRFRYQRFCSDIAGQDPAAHDDSPDRVILEVRKWIRADPLVQDKVRIPGHLRIQRRYRQFLQDLPFICEEADLEFDNLDYNDYTTLVAQWIESNRMFR